MRRTLVALLAAGLFLGGCGSDDDGGSGPSGGLSGTVSHFLYNDIAVPGIAVGSGNTVTASGTDGGFTLPGVSSPYTIAAAIPVVSDGGNIFAGYVGWSGDSPRLGAVPIGYGNPSLAAGPAAGPDPGRPSRVNGMDAAELDILFSGNDAGGSNLEFAIGGGQHATTRGTSAGATSYNNLEYRWPSALTHTVSIAALQQDSGSGWLYGRTTGVVLVRNTDSATPTVTLNPVAGGSTTISVDFTPPAGYTVDSISWYGHVIVGGLPLEAGTISTQSGSLTLPVIPGGTNYVGCEVRYVEGGGYQHSQPGVAAGGSVSLTGVAPPAVVSPADASTGITNGFDVELDLPASAQRNLLVLFGADAYGDISEQFLYFLPGDMATLPFPRHDAIGASLSPAATYQMSVYSIVGGANPPDALDILVRASSPYSPGQDIAANTAGPLTMVTSETVEFTTDNF